MNRRSVIRGAAAVGAISTFDYGLSVSQALGQPTIPLKDLLARCGGLVGTQAGRGVLQQTSPLSSYIRRNVSILTPGNDMKWSALRPSANSFYFEDADWVVAFCRENGIAVHGHNLCWNSYNPEWLANSLSSDNAEGLLKHHIETVAGRYRGKIDSWDVVNEPIATWFKRSDGLRDGPWLSALGANYIDIAFHAVAEADPKAIRVLNLNHVEQEEAGIESSREKTLELLSHLLSRKVPVQAVGLESHLSASKPADGPGLVSFLSEVMRMGLHIMITEIDVLDNSAPADITLRDAAVAQSYREYLDCVMSLASPKRLIFWSLSDRGNWYDKLPNVRRADQLPHRPGLLDNDMAPKPTMEAVISSLKRSCC